MATANELWGQIQENQAILDEYLGEAGQAPEKFREEVNKKVRGNVGAIKNAAGLESKAYSLPGELMNQYDQEFGGQTGLGAMSRMNSILKGIGNQFGLSNAAWGVVDNAKLRQEELIKQMNERFNMELGARQQKHNNLLPLWQQLHATENRPRGGGSSYNGPSWEELRKLIEEEKGSDTATQKTPSPMSSSGKMGASLAGGTFQQDYLGKVTPTPVNSGSWMFDQVANRAKGIRPS